MLLLLLLLQKKPYRSYSNEDEDDKNVVTGAATEVVVIGEWEFGGPCRSLAFTSSLESSFGSGCISRSEGKEREVLPCAWQVFLHFMHRCK